MNNTFSRLKNLCQHLLWFKKLSINVFYGNDLSLIEVFKSHMKQ